MAKQILEGLFESKSRVRVLRFLFRNFPGLFTISTIAKHTQVSRNEVRKELDNLAQIGLVRTKNLRIKKIK